MPFEIIIKQTGTETKTVGGDWTKLDTTFMTEKDFANLSFYDKNKIDKDDLATLKKDVMGYTPKTEKEVQFEREIYRQTVPELDLTAVVKAVNNLKF